MSKEDGRFDATYRPDPKSLKGKRFRTKLFDVLEHDELLADYIRPGRTQEGAFLAYLSSRAFDKDDPNSGMILDRLFSRSYPALKSTFPTVDIEYNRESSYSEQVKDILTAISKGQIPADIGNIFIQSIKAAADIEASTELKQRIEALEIVADEQRAR